MTNFQVYKIREIGEITDKASYTGMRVVFVDGTEVVIYAKIKRPPTEELTAIEIEGVDLETGIESTVSDGGISEIMNLEESSDGGKLVKLLTRIAAAILER